MIRRILSALLAPTVAEELAAIREQIGDLDSARAELDDVRLALGAHATPGRRLDDCVSALVARAADVLADATRTAADERADVLAMLTEQEAYERPRERAGGAARAAYRIRNGEHIGAAKKSAKGGTAERPHGGSIPPPRPGSP